MSKAALEKILVRKRPRPVDGEDGREGSGSEDAAAFAAAPAPVAAVVRPVRLAFNLLLRLITCLGQCVHLN